jgi:hypothetical protein
MSITITTPNLVEVRNEIVALTPALQKRTLLDMSQVAYDQMQSGAARHSKTGALFASVYNRSIPNGREVGHDPQRAPHALFVVFGTRPHVIVPKTKKALRWVSGNGFVFAGKVNHPGYRGDDYLTRAADEAVRQMPAIVDAAIKEK